MKTRSVIEGLQLQGADERIVYTITTTPWGSSPGSVAVVIKDIAASMADVTATTSTGSPSVGGDIITLPVIHTLTPGKYYRVEVKFTCGTSTFETYFEILAEL